MTKQYDTRFKRQALDEVLREYGSFFRVGHYLEDTRSIYLLTLCAMIDMAAARSDLTGETATPSVDPWRLDELARHDQNYFSHANWPCNNPALNPEQCYQRLLMILDASPFV